MFVATLFMARKTDQPLVHHSNNGTFCSSIVSQPGQQTQYDFGTGGVERTAIRFNNRTPRLTLLFATP
jgi:hypothetical protein